MAQNLTDPTFVREIQNMLRIIGRSTGENVLIIPENGIYDRTTEDAVRRFQFLYGLIQNGVVNDETFKRLTEIYDYENKRRGKTAPIRPYPAYEDYVLSVGEQSELVFILQLMLNALSIYYELPRIPVNGSFDPVTEAAVRAFQRVNMLPPTGTVDRVTWERLAEEYNESVNDNS